jgi:hypothetical protein
MNVRYNDPGLQVLTWRLEERALLARLEVRRQLGPRPTPLARLSAALLRPAGGVLTTCGRWLTELRDGARSLDVSGPAVFVTSRRADVDFAADRSTSR